MRKKVYLKEWKLAKQGLYKLKEEEKWLSNLVVKSPATLVYPLLLTNFFNLAFPELLFYNTP